MEFVNQTVVPAERLVAEMSDDLSRGGMVVAKATFELVSGGSARLVSQDPLPLLGEPTPLDDVGHMPADLVPREDEAFEVILLGACYGPAGRPVKQTRVAMSVGPTSHALLVSGDRVWVGSGAQATISSPAPFTRMPLVYERAFGGTAEVMLDPHSVYPVFDPLNARGRGFDPADYAAGCAATFACPPGFPAIAPGPRRLPNLEDTRCPIQRWNDQPQPACWATIPPDIGFMVKAMEAHLVRTRDASKATQAQAAYFRAHPQWTFSRPPAAGAQVVVEGVTPRGALRFSLPRLGIVADYEIGARTGTLPLKPHALLVLAEKMRFCLVYRAFFRFDAEMHRARSLRLRLVEGWHDGR